MASLPPPTRVLPPGMAVTHWTAPDGWRVRRFDWPAPAGRGGLFFQGGRGDIFEKYLESFAHWHAQGWTVAGFDWRGHGGSGRFDHRAGMRSEFAPAVEDLADQWARWTAGVAGPHVLIGHSMGGFLSLRALVDRRVAPDAAVLVAPMLGVRSPLGAGLSEWLARWQVRRGDPGRPIWSQGRHEAGRTDRMAMLTGDRARYLDGQWWQDQMAEPRVGAPSWAWLLEAFGATRALRDDPALSGVRTPLLMLAADRDRLVDLRAVQAVAGRLPAAELIRFPDAAHEILREVDAVRNRALAAIDAFLDRVAPRR